MAPSAPYKGECHCKAVQFTLTAEPTKTMHCFCQHCSKMGGPSQLAGEFATDSLTVTAGEDKIATYIVTDTTSGHPKKKRFCGQCGCVLWTIPARLNDLYRVIRLPLLQGGLEIVPQHEIFTAQRPSWMAPLAGVQQWEGSPKW